MSCSDEERTATELNRTAAKEFHRDSAANRQPWYFGSSILGQLRGTESVKCEKRAPTGENVRISRCWLAGWLSLIEIDFLSKSSPGG